MRAYKISIFILLVSICICFIGTANAQFMASPPLGLTLVSSSTTAIGPADTVTVNYTLVNAKGCEVYLRAYNDNNILVRTIDAGSQDSGDHSITWDGLCDNGTHAVSGAYTMKVFAAAGGTQLGDVIKRWVNGPYSQSIVFDAQGNLYMDGQVMCANGTILKFENLSNPKAVDSQGNVYMIANEYIGAYRGLVNKMYPNGTVVTLGSGFYYLRGVAVDSSGNVYVADESSSIKVIYANGTNGTVGYGFYEPDGVAVDSQGNVYVADTGNSAIKEIYTNGTIVTLGSFGYPEIVALDPYGNVYMGVNNAIYKIYPNGTSMLMEKGLNGLRSIAVDPYGTVFFTDDSQIVYQLIPTGTIKLGSELNQPGGMAVDASGNLYITDSSNGLIKKIGNDNSIETMASGLGNIGCIAVDKTGNMYVSDWVDQGVKKISPNGSATVLGSGIFSVMGIAVDSQGNVYVASYDTIKEIYANNTTYTLPLTGYGGYQRIAVNSSGNIVVTGMYGIYKIDTSGNKTQFVPNGYNSNVIAIDASDDIYLQNNTLGLQVFHPNGSVETLGMEAGSWPSSIAVDSAGDIYVVDNSAISEYNPLMASQPVRQWNYLSYVSHIAVDPSNNKFVIDGSSVKEFYANGTIRMVASNAGSGSSLNGIAVDSLDNVYVSNYTSVMKIIPDGSVTILANGLSDGEGLDVDEAGNVYVADYYNNAVKVIYTNGTIGTLGSGFYHPSDVAVKGADYLYVTDTGNNAVKYVTLWNNATYSSVNLTSPGNLAFGPGGDLYVTNFENNLIYLIGSSGASGNYSTGYSSYNDIAVDSSGNVYVTAGNTIDEITPASKVQVGGHFINPTGIAFDGSGNIYLLEQSAGDIKKINVDNVVTTVVQGLSYPEAFAVDPAGNIYMPDNANSTIKMLHSDGSISSVGSNISLGNLAVDPQGNLYGTFITSSNYMTYTSINGVLKIYPNGTSSVIAGGIVGMMYNNGLRIAVDSNSNVFVANSSGVIYRIDGVTGTVTAINSGISSPNAMAVDSLDNIYVSGSTYVDGSYISNTFKVYPDGSNSTLNLSSGYANALGIDPEDHLFVIDSYNITEYGTGSTVVSDPLPVTVSYYFAPVAGFSSDLASGVAPLTVKFVDMSTGFPASWQWDFGDGSVNSTESSPVHTYDSPGNYTVTLTVSNDAGSSTAQAVGYVTVERQPLVASFNASAYSGYGPLTVNFNDSSSGFPASWEWNFGDGLANETTQNVTHTYTIAGTYNVTLTVSNGPFSDSTSTQIVVKALVVGPVKNLRNGLMFLTIQDAINDADTMNGDTIQVNSGVYRENVVVNKSINLVGAVTDVIMPVVDGHDLTAIEITAGNVTLQGFNVTNAKYGPGIYVESNNNTITGSSASGCYFGIYVAGSSNNVTGNTLWNNGWGIYLYGASYNNLVGNTANSNNGGVRLVNSSYNNLSENSFCNNTNEGIQLAGYMYVGSCYNEIYRNTVDNNGYYGIEIDGMSYLNVLWLNHINGNNYGNGFDGTGNANYWRSYTPIQYTYNDQLYTNYTGNYWGDYSGTDANGDGIGDTSYLINNVTDYLNYDDYPMMLPNSHTGFTLTLKRGWNLVSSPLVVDPAINVSVFKGTNVTMVARYNKTTGGFDIYRVGKTPVAFPFVEGQGYFLYCSNDTTYSVSGYSESGQTTTISQGWNLIGWTNLTSTTSKALAQGLYNVTMLAKFNTTSSGYDIYRVGKTPTPFAIQAGEGYFLYTTYTSPQTLVMG